jgi:hypothetical protein
MAGVPFLGVTASRAFLDVRRDQEFDPEPTTAEMTSGLDAWEQ